MQDPPDRQWYLHGDSVWLTESGGGGSSEGFWALGLGLGVLGGRIPFSVQLVALLQSWHSGGVPSHFPPTLWGKQEPTVGPFLVRLLYTHLEGNRGTHMEGNSEPVAREHRETSRAAVEVFMVWGLGDD